MKKLAGFLMIFAIFVSFLVPFSATAEEEKEKKAVPVTADSVILLEMENGTVLFEKNADQPKKIASVTKVMTLLLIYEALDSGKIALTDSVTVSEHAASMGGSQVFLEPYETQTVETMIKCICISSANDASVAMAEHIAGSEEAFVTRMNQRASELNMKQTTFVNCCGLDVEGHVSCARDVAIMSAELMKNHSSIQRFTTTWMDTITHTTKRGESSFGLANTNKLIKQYHGITGLKTGSTDAAKYCLSATAERNGVRLVAVVLAAPDTKSRFREAAALLDYGFANCELYTEDGTELPKTAELLGGQKKEIEISLQAPFSYIFSKKEKKEEVKKAFVLKENLKAPVEIGDIVGEYVYTYQGKELGRVPVISKEQVAKATFFSSMEKCVKLFFR